MIKQLRNWIQESKHIVFFGGAGTSTESNIPDFRTDKGLFMEANKWPYPPETMISHSFFMEHPQLFFSYYREKLLYPNAKPNGAHYALAKLEREGKLKAVITQNIDGLHQAAGSQNVLELHGSVHRNYCLDCGARYSLREMLELDGIVPKCATCGGLVRPDVVLYEEALDEDVIKGAINQLLAADLLIVGGTSLVVYPAAGLLQYYGGDRIVLINRDATSLDRRADLVFREPIGQVLLEAVNGV